MMTNTDIREFRNRFEVDWALPPGCRAKTIAMCCEKCVYDSGKHTCASKKKVPARERYRREANDSSAQ